MLNAKAQWREQMLQHLALNGSRVKLQTLPRATRALVDGTGSFGGMTLPSALAVDAEGRIYILDGRECLLKRYDPCLQAFEVLPCVGGTGSAPRQLSDPHGLAISRQGDLYVADTANRRIQIFSGKGLSLRAIWGPFRFWQDEKGMRVERTMARRPAGAEESVCEPAALYEDGTWMPWGIAVSAEGWVYVSDFASGLIHCFDARGRWRGAFDGQMQDGTLLSKPTALALGCEGKLYVAQQDRPYIVVLDHEGHFLETINSPPELEGRFLPVAVAVDDAGHLCITDRGSRSAYWYCSGRSGVEYAGVCLGYLGIGGALAFDGEGNPILADTTQSQILCLDPRAAYASEGTFISEPLDSEIYDCQWHRVLMRAAIVEGTQLRVDTFTYETRLAPEEIALLDESRWAQGAINAEVGEGEWDCLVASPPGRYLWLRITFEGNGAETPALDWVEVYFPRLSSLQYLPAVYSRDAVSRQFLDRFLSIFDTVREGIEDNLATGARYFDPNATPDETGHEFLAWLASWLGMTLDRRLTPAQRRALVKNAHRLYALRGTPEGLRWQLELATGREPHLLEHFKLRRWLFVNHARLGDASALWGDAVVKRLQLDVNAQVGVSQLIDSGDPLRDPFYRYAYQFTVFVPGSLLDDPDRAAFVKSIVESSKPAHTLAHIQPVQPRLRVGVQAFIGVDTVIGRYPERVVAGESRLGYDSVLGASEGERHPPTMQVGQQARIGVTTRLD